MNKKHQLSFLFFFIFFISFLFAQKTVYIHSTEFGRGILKSRTGECFVITPLHVVDGGAGSAKIIGGRNVLSSGVFLEGFPHDLAVIRVTGGGQQDCEDWTVDENFDDIISTVVDGYLELRSEDGNVQNIQVFIKEKTTDLITIIPKQSEEIFVKGMSGASLFTTKNERKIYLGMLQEIDAESGKGYVYQADDMERILGSFFIEKKASDDSRGKPKRIKATIQSDPIPQQIDPKASSELINEDLGFQFEFKELKKSGGRVTCRLEVTSLENDANLEMYYQTLHLYDEQGLHYVPSNITLGSSNGTNIKHWLEKGQPTKLEITFENVASSAQGIAAFYLNFTNESQSSLVKYQNLSFMGLGNGLSLPKQKGNRSEEMLGFDFQFVKYKKSGSRVTVQFMATSTEKDNVLKMYYQNLYLYDELGHNHIPSNIKIANSSGTNVNHFMVQGVQVSVELVFNNVSSNAKGISLLGLLFSDEADQNGRIEFRNLSFEGFETDLVLPRKEGSRMEDMLGFDFQFVNYEKTGSRVAIQFMVTSKEKDNTLKMYYQNLQLYDELGHYYIPSNIKIANSSGTNVNHFMVQGVQNLVEIVFNNVSSNAQGISLLGALFSDGADQNGRIEFRNLSFNGFETDLVLPREEGSIKEDMLGFDFQFVNYEKTGSRVAIQFMVTSKEKDNTLKMYYQNLYLYDELGHNYIPSNIKIANSSGTNVNHFMVQGIQVSVELVFDNVSSNAKGISLLGLYFSDAADQNGQIQFRNLSFDGFETVLDLPYRKGQQEANMLDFDFQLINCNKSGSRISCNFGVTSKVKDNSLKMYYQSINLSDDQNNLAKTSKIWIANTSGTNVNHFMVQGVQVPVELIFDKVSSSTTSLPYLKIQFSDENNNGELIWENISLN